MVPDTVKSINLNQNKLRGIGDWQDLKGKSLEYLSVERNPALILDLTDLGSNQHRLSLRKLSVTKAQITGWFALLGGVMGADIQYQRLHEWVMGSSLDSLLMACRSGHGSRRFIKYFRNGTYIANLHGIQWDTRYPIAG